MWRPVLNIFSAVAGDEQEQQQYRGGGEWMGDALNTGRDTASCGSVS